MLLGKSPDMIDARVLDGVSECDADTVALLVVLDFLKGPHQLAWRIPEWLNGHTLSREDEVNPIGVCAALATALKVLLYGLTPLNQIDADLVNRPGESGDFLI